MKYLSVCSGIEAATVAWHPIGFTPVGFAEIEKFPSAVLAHRYPGVPNFGDLNKYKEWNCGHFDILVGGTPCQSFSVAGLRKGLDDPRGNLALTYVGLLAEHRPRWFVWENVPGVLSIDGGRAFGSLLGAMAQLGYGFAYRILDAQYVRVDGFHRAVPQRRRRIFVVGYLGDWRRAAAVLFDRESLLGNPAPGREARQSLAQPIANSLGGSSQSGGFRTTDLDNQGAFIPAVSPPLRAAGNETGGDRPHGTDVDTCTSLIPTVSKALSAARGNACANADDQETYIPAVADPIAANEQRTYTHEGAHNFRTRNVVTQAVANPLTHRMHKGVNTTMDEGQTMVAHVFKSSHYTRGKDGAPSTVVPPLGKEPDRGDQDNLLLVPPAVAFQPRFARNGRGAPDDVASALTGEAGRTGKGDSAQCVAFDTTQITSPMNYSVPKSGDACHPLASTAHVPAVAFQTSQSGVRTADVHATLDSHNGSRRHNGVVRDWAVRRLTPTECERLQGFPDGYTHIPWGKGPMPDGPRYKALGNSMAVNVMRWIGRRIEMVEAHDAD